MYREVSGFKYNFDHDALRRKFETLDPMLTT